MNRPDLSSFHVSSHEVRRCLGYADQVRAREDIENVFQRVMEIGPKLLEPAACYDVFSKRKATDTAVRVQDSVSFHSRDLALRHRGAGYLGAFAVTAGVRLEQEAESLIQGGESVRGYLLDAFASAAVSCLTYEVKDRIEENARSKGCQAITHATCLGKKCPVYRDCGGAIVHWWCPGYGDWSVLENGELVSLLEGNRIGVTVRESGMLSPQKSYVGAMPIGSADETSREDCVEWQKDWVRPGLKAR